MTSPLAHHDAMLIAEYRVLVSGGALWAIVSWIRSMRRR